MSQGAGGTATILYATVAPEAREARLEIRDPLLGRRQARVIVRPVDLTRLESLITAGASSASARERAAFAHSLAFG